MIAARAAATWPTMGRTRAVTSMDAHRRLAQLIERDLDRAYRLAGLILRDATEAEEAVGDAIEAAFRHVSERRDPAAFSAWFDRILVNRCRDRLRRRGRIRFIALPDGAVDRADPFADILAHDEAVRALGSLTDDERIVVVLHYWADLTLHQVAQRTGQPVGTIKSRLHRALERLRASGAVRRDPA
jgi:RNA polymerase sigma-70 factor (ECF subfamily)